MVRCTCVLLVALLSACSTSRAQQADELPSITYPGSRSSTGWVDTGSGQVGVDRFLRFDGKRVYLSLTCDLLVTDGASEKARWSHFVGAFWDTVAIEKLTVDEEERLVIALRSSDDPDQVSYRDLDTGAELPQPAALPGVELPVRMLGRGDQRADAEPRRVLVATQEDWDALRAELFAGLDVELEAEVDFAEEVVILVALGEGWNCGGLSCSAAYEDDERVLVRLFAHTFQTVGPDGGGVLGRAWGAFTLPRRPGKPYVLERNAQRYIAGPPLWQEVERLRLDD